MCTEVIIRSTDSGYRVEYDREPGVKLIGDSDSFIEARRTGEYFCPGVNWGEPEPGEYSEDVVLVGQLPVPDSLEQSVASQVSKGHQALLGLIQRYYAAWEGESAGTPELLEVAVEALARKALTDHPQGGAERLRIPPEQAERINAAREALSQHLHRVGRQPRGKRTIRLA